MKEGKNMEKMPLIFVVGTKVGPEREEEFNEWYDKVHIPMVLKAPGMVRAARYRIVGAEDDLPQYLAIYELESEEAIKLWEESPEREAARQDSLKQQAETGFTVVCRGYYKHLGSWGK